MMILFEKIVFSPKKRVVFSILMASMMSVMIIIPLRASAWDPSYADLALISDQKMIAHLLSLIMVFLTTWIVMDLEHPLIVTLNAYFGFWRIHLSKLIFLLMWIVMLYLPLSLIQNGIIIFLTGRMPTIDVFNIALHDIFDAFLISTFAHPLAKSKHPSLALLFPILYTILRTITSNDFSMKLYTIFPAYQHEIIHYELAIAYKLCYISLGLLLISHFLKRRPPF
jgi:hypothetical protein